MPAHRLFHVSEDPNIQNFEPRLAPNPDAGVTGNAVWAIDETHLPNYLLPRDCPRVTYGISARTSDSDREKFFLGSNAKRIVAVEAGWHAKIEACQLYLYEFPTGSFALLDAGAGYYISRAGVQPQSVTRISGLIPELLHRKVELRFLPCLWPLRDAVIASTLEFSVIRFRNAAPRLN